MKFGMRVQTWDILPAENFVKIAQGDLFLRGKFLTKIRNFRDFELLKHTFQYQFRQNRSRGLPVLYCLGGDAY